MVPQAILKAAGLRNYCQLLLKASYLNPAAWGFKLGSTQLGTFGLHYPFQLISRALALGLQL